MAAITEHTDSADAEMQASLSKRPSWVQDTGHPSKPTRPNNAQVQEGAQGLGVQQWEWGSPHWESEVQEKKCVPWGTCDDVQRREIDVVERRKADTMFVYN